jgi:ornithine cyclodeaminase
MAEPRFYSEAQVQSRLSMPALIEAMHDVMIAVSRDQVHQPLRTVHELDDTSLLFLKPVFTPSVIAIKAITQMPANAAVGLPSMMATLLLMSRTSGQLLAVMQATALTNLRTAAVSAVAVRKLTQERPLVVAILGSGALAKTHALALRAVRSVSELRIWSPTPNHRVACSIELQAIACDSAQTACADADVIVTATLASQPILKGEWIKPGALVCAVGAARPTWRELDSQAMLDSIVLVDSRHAAQAESGDILLSGAKIYAQLGDILSGHQSIVGAPTIVFKSLGLAAQDAAAAQLVLNAKEVTY